MVCEIEEKAAVLCERAALKAASHKRAESSTQSPAQNTVHCNIWFELENLLLGMPQVVRATHLFMAMVRGVIFGFKAKRVSRHLSASRTYTDQYA